MKKSNLNSLWLRSSSFSHFRLSKFFAAVALLLMTPIASSGEQRANVRLQALTAEKVIKAPVIEKATQVVDRTSFVISETTINSTKRYRYIPGGKGLPKDLLKSKQDETLLLDNNKKAAMGPGSTGGGFLYFRGAMPATTRALNFLIYQFENMNQNYLNFFLPDELKNKISPQKIGSYLRRTTYSYFQEGTTVAPDNSVDLLEADFIQDKNNPHIILLKSFFQRYIDVDPTNAKLPFIMRTILHETLHLFGIGITKDSDAYELSFNLVAAVAGKFDGCTTEQSCQALKTEDAEHLFNDLRMAYNKDLTAVQNQVIAKAFSTDIFANQSNDYKLVHTTYLHGSFLQVLSSGYCSKNPNYLVCLQEPLLRNAAYSEYVSPTLLAFLNKEVRHENTLAIGSYFEFKSPQKSVMFILRPPDADSENNSPDMKNWVQTQNTGLCASQSMRFISSKKWNYVTSTMLYVICESDQL